MSATLIKSFVALVPSSMLFVGSIILFSKTKNVGSVLQLLGAGCLIVMILTHVAIEIDADRAAGCIRRGITTIHGSAFECKVQSESCSLLYLNPPYDTELGPHHNRRMELVFLEQLLPVGKN